MRCGTTSRAKTRLGPPGRGGRPGGGYGWGPWCRSLEAGNTPCGATGLLYDTGYRDVDGIIIPATRRGYAWQGDYQLVPEPLLVAIDMGEITIR